jgi:hypothetical protein
LSEYAERDVPGGYLTLTAAADRTGESGRIGRFRSRRVRVVRDPTETRDDVEFRIEDLL